MASSNLENPSSVFAPGLTMKKGKIAVTRRLFLLLHLLIVSSLSSCASIYRDDFSKVRNLLFLNESNETQTIEFTRRLSFLIPPCKVLPGQIACLDIYLGDLENDFEVTVTEGSKSYKILFRPKEFPNAKYHRQFLIKYSRLSHSVVESDLTPVEGVYSYH